MKAIISDLHSNLQATEAVFAELDKQGVAEVICLGDIVGYNANPAEVLALVRGRCSLVLQGNHDAACLDQAMYDWFNGAAQKGVKWALKNLNHHDLDYLLKLPDRVLLGNGVGLVHGSLRDPLREYVMGETVAPNLQLLEQSVAALAHLTPVQAAQTLSSGVAFHGHSHVAGAFTFTGHPLMIHGQQVAFGYEADSALTPKSPMLINPGSVGQPRDRDPRASFLLWDDTPAEDAPLGRIKFCRVEYDIPAAQAAIRTAGLPESLAARLEVGG